MAKTTRAKIGDTILDLEQGDITKQTVDAIVNAANSALAGGGGVDGAIHRAAGWQQLQAELRRRYPEGCPTGQARITDGYDLPAKHIIHAVGPVYAEAGEQAPDLLAGAHRSSLKLAQEHNLKSIAFSAISTGVYGYPLEEAAAVAFNAVADYINENQPDFELVRFVLFNDKVMRAFSEGLAARIAARDDISAI